MPKSKRGAAVGDICGLLAEITRGLKDLDIAAQRPSIRRRMLRFMRGANYRSKAITRAARGPDPESALVLLEMSVQATCEELLQLHDGLARDRHRATSTPVPSVKH